MWFDVLLCCRWYATSRPYVGRCVACSNDCTLYKSPRSRKVVQVRGDSGLTHSSVSLTELHQICLAVAAAYTLRAAMRLEGGVLRERALLALLCAALLVPVSLLLVQIRVRVPSFCACM